MKNRPFQPFLLIFIVGIIAFNLISPNATSPENLVDADGNFLLDVVFHDFYEKLNGYELCGKPLTSKYLGDYGYYEQTTTNCLLYYDAASKEVKLGPLGILLNLYSDEAKFDSIPVHPYISTAYYETITPKYAGNPISPPDYNSDSNLWIQNFENISIAYHLESETFQLLSLGSQYCEIKRCNSPQSNNSLSTPPQSVSEFIERYPQFGSVILDEYINDEGVKEYIFNGVVLYMQNNKVYLKALPNAVGIHPTKLENRISNDIYDEKLFQFFYIEAEMGYNIPMVILNYVNQHLGGTRVSGPPISGNHLLIDNIAEVCFTAYCLRYNLKENSIQLANLGVSYYDQVFNQGETTTDVVSDAYNNLNIIVTSDQSVLTETIQSTTIHVLLIYDGVPLENVVPTIKISTNQKITNYQMPPTDKNGETIFVLEGSLLPNENGNIGISICVLFENETSQKCEPGKNIQLILNP